MIKQDNICVFYRQTLAVWLLQTIAKKSYVLFIIYIKYSNFHTVLIAKYCSSAQLISTIYFPYCIWYKKFRHTSFVYKWHRVIDYNAIVYIKCFYLKSFLWHTHYFCICFIDTMLFTLSKNKLIRNSYHFFKK